MVVRNDVVRPALVERGRPRRQGALQTQVGAAAVEDAELLVVAIFNTVLNGVNGVGLVFSLTSGGPGTSTQIISYLLYNVGWTQIRFGRAAALALIIAVINWLLIIGTMRITRSEERQGEA